MPTLAPIATLETASERCSEGGFRTPAPPEAAELGEAPSESNSGATSEEPPCCAKPAGRTRDRTSTASFERCMGEKLLRKVEDARWAARKSRRPQRARFSPSIMEKGAIWEKIDGADPRNAGDFSNQ